MAGKHFKGDDATPQGTTLRRDVQGTARSSADWDLSEFEDEAPGRRRRHVWPFVVLALVLALVGGVAFCGYTLYSEAMSVRDDAYAILDVADDALSALKQGDGDELLSIAADIEERAERMRDTTQGTLWNLAAELPVYGTDIQTVQQLAELLAELSSGCITPVCEDVAGASSEALFADGAINVELISLLVDDLLLFQDDITAACEAIEALPAAHIDQIQSALDKVQPYMSTVREALDTLCEIAPVLPQLLGADGQTRTYVVIAQNNSEIRSTGGYPGSIGTVTITDGVIEVGSFSGTSQYLGNEDVVAEVTDQEQAMFGSTSAASTIQLVTKNPDFVVTGQHLLEIWESKTGGTADGVVALDPVFLQSLLELTGASITLADGTVLDGSNAASYLLNGVYKAVTDTDEQDELFAEAAKATATSILSSLSSVDLTELLTAVTEGAEESRLLVYMKDDEEEAVIAQLGLDGGLSYDETAPVLGVYLNDETWGKICYYLSCSTVVGEAVANDDGTVSYTVTTTLKNNLTTDELSLVTTYITGYNTMKDSVDTMVLQVFLYAPAGGTISDITCSMGYAFYESSYGSLQTWMIGSLIHLDAQEECVFTYTVTVSAAATEELQVRTTPTAQEVAGW